MKWKPPRRNETNGRIRYFLLNITEVETGVSRIIRVNSTTHLFNDLHPFYNYDVLVSAVTTAAGPYSSSYSVLTKESGVLPKMYY